MQLIASQAILIKSEPPCYAEVGDKRMRNKLGGGGAHL